MRGRSLLKESSNSSLCAFCACRLGQPRAPSHVQRRFLQSSRPVSRPPAEGTAVHENNESKSLGPTWGRPGPIAGNGSPVASWGRPGGIPSKPGALGGERMEAGKGMPPSKSDAESISYSPAKTFGNSISSGSRPPGSPAPDNSVYLDPHEQAARKRMLEQQARSHARPVTKVYGSGPESTRAGRPQPRGRHEMLDSAKRQLARRKEFDSPLEVGEQTGRLSASGPRISRHVVGDSAVWAAKTGPPDDHVTWNGGHLRRKNERNQNNIGKSRYNEYVESRSQREEQAKTSGYRPLSSRSFKPTWDSHAMQRSREQDKPSWAQEFGARMADLALNPPKKPQPPPAEKSISADQDTPTTNQETAPEQVPKGFTTMLDSRIENFPMLYKKPAPKDELEDEDDEGERGPRKKKDRKRRGGSENMIYEKALPKGKERDKEKRRQQFVKDEAEEAASIAAAARAETKRLRKLEKAAEKAAQASAPTPIFLPEYISVSNLAVALKVRFEDFVRKMQELGFEETSHDHILNAENAGLIALEYNFEPIIERGESEDLRAREPALDPSILPQRPPVVTIMGHVDHGKTTLLDWLRKSSVAATEHGGITQHIGAFSVPMPSGKVITFLDTPGHAAFLSMRQRGANVTDIVILVVAADDSVKPQTIEAINHAQAAKVPIIVAINKIDKDQANVDRVKQDLARHGIDVEDFGGETQVVCVSGKTGQGMGELEEAVVTLSEILDMRAETDGLAEGWVLEASIKSMGKVATVLVRRGTMRPGDFIVAGSTWARIRVLRNEAGVEIDEAGPGTPVQIDGWREQPLAGDEVLQAPDEGKAKSVVEFRLEKQERDKLAEDMEAINENRKEEQEKKERLKAEALAAEEAKAEDEEAPEKEKFNKPTGPREIFFVVKGDVSGSVEAVVDSMAALGTKEVRPHILRSAVGQVAEFDIEHAAAAKGIIINFNTPIEPNIARLAADAKVTIMDHNIIYRLVDDVKAELSKLLPPLITQRVLGEAEIAQVFSITVKGRQQKSIAGCKVRNGTISKTAKIRVLRGGEKVFEGTLDSLKNVKKDVAEMKKGSECGMGFTDWFDFHVGDQVQSYEEKHEKRYL